jgi:hypothetical protein
MAGLMTPPSLWLLDFFSLTIYDYLHDLIDMKAELEKQN